MPDIIIKKRMTHLEKLMAHLIETVDRTDEQLARTDRQMEITQRRLDQFSADMQDFKAEMQEFKIDIRQDQKQFSATLRQDQQQSSATLQQNQEEFSAALQQNQEEFSAALQQNQKEFSAALQQNQERYEQESRAEIRAMNKKWGELSNKMGTMAEDLVAPSVGRILRETVGGTEQQIDYIAVRVRKRHPLSKKNQEYDVVAVCGDYLLINETKSSLRPRDVKDFVAVLSEARGFFPEYADKSIIGALGSLYVDDSFVRSGERAGLIVLGFGEDVMDVLNSPGFIPKTF